MAELLEVEHVFKHASKFPENPEFGDLLVYHHFERYGDGRTHHLYKVQNSIHAIKVIDKLADEQVNDEEIAWNAIGLMVFEEIAKERDKFGILSKEVVAKGEWCDWTNDDGLDIDEYKEELKERKEEVFSRMKGISCAGKSEDSGK